LGPLVDGELIDDRALEVKDDDQFGLQTMAVELADMCLQTKTPANIAVLGPWGSGKSSLGKLTLKELSARRKSNVRTMAFDAFKYAENPLRRVFEPSDR
ncbi:MAG: P-loop NTPase fold protein, partial [Mycobacteriales bacterium]